MRRADEFADDGGTPGWRARHATVIDIYPSRWQAVRAHLKRHPWTIFCLFVAASLLPYCVMFFGLVGLTIWYSLFG